MTKHHREMCVRYTDTTTNVIMALGGSAYMHTRVRMCLCTRGGFSVSWYRGRAVSSEYLIITHSLGSTQSMRQFDVISCFHQAGPPPGPQPSQKRCPPPHPAFQAHGAQIRLPGLVDHTHPAFLSTAPRNVPPGQRGPPRPLKLRFALTEALRPAFPWSAMISLSELLWLPW